MTPTSDTSDELRGLRAELGDLRSEIRELRDSLLREVHAASRRFDNLADEVRKRITISEKAILNEIRDLGRESDRRLTWMEDRVADVERQVGERPT